MGIFHFNDIYNKSNNMKIRLTEAQYKALEEYIEEARQAPKPVSLSALFNDNPTAQFFSVTKRQKRGIFFGPNHDTNDEYFFKIFNENGHKGFMDVNPGTKTKGCKTDANFDTILYGNQITINFGSCGKLVINNVTDIKLFANEEDAKSGSVMDSQELEHDLDTTKEEKLDRYYDIMKEINNGEEVYIDTLSKKKYDGTVIRKTPEMVVIELVKQGSKEQPHIVSVGLEFNPFLETEKGIYLMANSAKRGDEQNQQEFQLGIANLEMSERSKPKLPTKLPTERPVENPEEEEEAEDKPIGQKTAEELKKDVKYSLEMILNDPILKQAFYKHPTFMDYLIAANKGKKATGSGILPTLQLLNSYGINKIDNNLNADFIANQSIEYTPLAPISIPYVENGVNKIFERNTDKTYSILVRDYVVNDKYRVLKDKKEKYKILIKNPTENEDVYNCDVIKYVFEKTGKEEYTDNDVLIKISKQSEGYKIKNKKNTKTNINPIK